MREDSGYARGVDDDAHIPVMQGEVLDALDPRQGETFLDCTAGLGGHAAAVARRLGPDGTVVLVDLDPGTLDHAPRRVRAALRPDDPGSARVVAIHANFLEAPAAISERGIRADTVLADLGFASPQVEDPARGLSFRLSGPLDMRLDPGAPITAAELVNTLPERDLAEILTRLGEERHARRIAQKVVEARASTPISTTDQLADLVRSAIPRPSGPIHPATRTFQALRIAVNDELGSLDALLSRIAKGAAAARSGEGWLNPGARIAFIAFHSLEDRPVKRALAAIASDGLGELITRKPLEAGADEIGRNPRSRSAKLRALRVSGPPA